MLLAAAVCASVPSPQASAKVPLRREARDLAAAIMEENACRATKSRERIAKLDQGWTLRDDVQRLRADAVFDPSTLYTRPSEAPGFVARDAEWRAARPKLMYEVRRRRLELRRHLSALSTRYRAAQKAWTTLQAKRQETGKAERSGGRQSENVGSILTGMRRSRDRGSSLLDGIVRSDYEQEMVFRRITRVLLSSFCCLFSLILPRMLRLCR